MLLMQAKADLESQREHFEALLQKAKADQVRSRSQMLHTHNHNI